MNKRKKTQQNWKLYDFNNHTDLNELDSSKNESSRQFLLDCTFCDLELSLRDDKLSKAMKWFSFIRERRVGKNKPRESIFPTSLVDT